LPPQDTGPAFNFLYTNGAFTTLPPVYFADPAAINNLGQILYSAAWTPYNDVQRSSLLYVNGQFDAIRVPGSSLTSALGINNVGQIVGWSIGGGPNFVYAAGLYSRLRFPDEDGISYSVYGINDAGQIVGSFSDGTTDHGFIGTIIPEASSSILIALGLTVIVVNCRMNRGRLRSQ
jgi:uncharacterized membrane protein